MSSTLPPRHELKFIIKSDHYGLKNIFYKLQNEAFVRKFPKRVVNNIYFETYNFSSINDNLAGISSREKVRLRWYGESDNIHNAQLEIKKRRSSLIEKTVFNFDDINISDGMNKSDVFNSIANKLDQKLINTFLNYPQIVLYNQYERDYFETLDGMVRMTVDCNIGKCNLIYKNQLEFNPLDVDKNILIIELKFRSSEWERVQKITSNWNLRANSYSKMVNSFA